MTIEQAERIITLHELCYEDSLCGLCESCECDGCLFNVDADDFNEAMSVAREYHTERAPKKSMTQREAVNWIKSHHYMDLDGCQDSEAMRLAVEALEREIKRRERYGRE